MPRFSKERDGASLAEVKEVEAALRHATAVHPNGPILTTHRYDEEVMYHITKRLVFVDSFFSCAIIYFLKLRTVQL